MCTVFQLKYKTYVYTELAGQAGKMKGGNHLLAKKIGIPKIRGGLSSLFTRPARSKILTRS